MKFKLLSAFLLVSWSLSTLADVTYTMNNQSITKFRVYSTSLQFETNSFDESNCDDESIRLSYNTVSGAQLFDILRDAAEQNTTLKSIQYYWDSSEENCYLRFIDID